ncbi:putative putrescine N-hydroxycinnamoyltransferase [Lupinus albus]|uniref:Putative putrescine N-hydroxycinnamoyltransferase n=1 Tax=Lupinus albus TaxID=3870 RepID=A0A6A4PR97_LUPAL|nr:putative putrescine N-hydroxycinnamoyltransferase [Lupinus albus]
MICIINIFTWFKCGGLSVGLSWAHVLGDAFSAFNFITKWSQILVGQIPPKSLHTPNIKEPEFPPSYNINENPISIKKATVVGEYWLGANNSDVVTHSFHFTFKQLQHLVTATSNQSQITNTIKTNKTSYFEIISAMLLKSIAHIRGDFGTRVLTICTNNNSNRYENEFPNNGLVLSKIEADLGADMSYLARLIEEKKMVENHIMEKLIEKDEGKEDYIVYGANLTFVDLEEAEIYGVKLNGHKPIMANCTIHGVGDQGVVLVLPAPEDIDDAGNGRIVTVSLPEKELNQLKDKIRKEWSIV